MATRLQMSLYSIAMCVPRLKMAGDNGRKTAITNFRTAYAPENANFIRKSGELFKILKVRSKRNARVIE